MNPDKFALEIRTANAAFGDDRKAELARILRHIASSLERGSDQGTVHDHNGNPVGHWYDNGPDGV